MVGLMFLHKEEEEEGTTKRRKNMRPKVDRIGKKFAGEKGIFGGLR